MCAAPPLNFLLRFLNDRQTVDTQGTLKFSKVAVPPLKLVAKVRDHFGIEICDSGKNK
jgi:hypothetical protein